MNKEFGMQDRGVAQDSGFWTWPVDMAAERARSRWLVMGSAALYWVGALVLLAQMVLHLSSRVAVGGAVLIALGVVGSVGVVGKVLVTRSRLTS